MPATDDPRFIRQNPVVGSTDSTTRSTRLLIPPFCFEGPLLAPSTSGLYPMPVNAHIQGITASGKNGIGTSEFHLFKGEIFTGAEQLIKVITLVAGQKFNSLAMDVLVSSAEYIYLTATITGGHVSPLVLLDIFTA